ncbi:type VII secretion protein EccB [Mycobacterium sp. DL592]|uniref:type VII secretion protein EccB n=1 Tax=Mycobacterium sp. DL592 TaxID=2675524 RepID=UPI00141FCD25|nr:type VII secretion protein EccB [Mycobacterium sp. DL592]
MTGPARDPQDRQSFTARTPVNANPDRVSYRRGFVTRHQVTGWRFVLRRIASGVALNDTRMLVDPLRGQSRAVLTGVLLAVTGLIGCFVFSVIRPGGEVGNNDVLADRDSAALYVRVNDVLHPVLNLTSARLAVGKPVNPADVRSTALDTLSRGPAIGIPGAPERIVQDGTRDANWTVCEGLPPAAAGVTVIAGPLVENGEHAKPLQSGSAILADNGSGKWLLWNGRRSAIDLNDRSVTSALGLGNELPAARPISPALFNAIPESAPLSQPVIADAGQPPAYALPAGIPVGSVVSAYGPDNAPVFYAVLADGVQEISPVLAAVLRNGNSYGFAQPPQLTADDIARAPVSRALDAAAFPDREVKIVDTSASPVTCLHWAKPDGASVSSQTLLAGGTLPVGQNAPGVDLVRSGGAQRAVLKPGVGYFVQTVGQQPASPSAGSLFWVSDTGVRFGIDGGTAKDGTKKTVAALGLTQPPLPVPWSVLALLTPGPALSQADALAAYTGTENR